MMALKTIQIETHENPDAAVIWLHGLGADGNDFVPIVPELKLPENLAIRFIFPNAPVRPITLNQGYPMPGWYDICSLDIVSDEDESGIKASSQAIASLCEAQESSGISSERIILAGFSQGGAIALYCGTRYPRPLAGIMALSTYLPMQAALEQEAADANKQTDIFMAHGQHDDVVASRFGKQSYDLLSEAGYPVHWHGYAMSHSVCAEEVSDIGTWLENRLS